MEDFSDIFREITKSHLFSKDHIEVVKFVSSLMVISKLLIRQL